MVVPLLPYVLIGSVLGIAVAAFSFRSLALPIAALIGVSMIARPRLAYFALIATTPIYFGFASGTRYQMAVLLPILAVMLVNACTRRGPWPMVVRWPEGYLAVAFCVAIGASLLQTPNPLFSALTMVSVYAPIAFIFFATLTFVRTKEDFENVCWVLVWVGVVEAMFAILEAKSGLAFSLVLIQARETSLVGLDDDLGVVGTTWHPSVLGAFLTMTISTALYKFIQSRRQLVRLGALAAILFMTYAIYLTYSRLALLGVAASIATAVLVTSRMARYVAVGVLVVFIVLLASRDFSFVSLIQDFERTAMPDALRRGGGLFNSTWYALVYRFETWGIAWNMFLSNPLLGVGMGQTASGWNPDFLPTWATTWGLITTPEQPNAGTTHNAFLAILAEHGIIAFVAFVGLWFWAIRCLVAATKNAALRPPAVLLSAIMAGQLVYLMMNPIARDFSIILALAAVLGRLAVGARVPEAADLERPASGLKAGRAPV